MAGSDSSPNVRIREATNREFHRLHAELMVALRLGSRGITQDVFVAALLSVGDAHFHELVEATRTHRQAALDAAEERTRQRRVELEKLREAADRRRAKKRAT